MRFTAIESFFSNLPAVIANYLLLSMHHYHQLILVLALAGSGGARPTHNIMATHNQRMTPINTRPANHSDPKCNLFEFDRKFDSIQVGFTIT